MATEEEEKEIAILVENMKRDLRNNPLTYEYRLHYLDRLEHMIKDNQDELIDAAKHHLRLDNEGANWYTCIEILLREIREMQNALEDLMKPKKIPLSIPYSLAWRSEEVAEPRGVVLIIAPWDMPIALLLRPLIGAIAAGNAVILKSSIVTSKVTEVLTKLLNDYLKHSPITIVTGRAATVQCLIRQKLDFVFFTGSTSVGSEIMRACAANVTKCLLELGGKNPVFIDDEANIEIAATRIAQGRFNVNCGQIGLSPEYVFISEENMDEFVETVRTKMREWHISRRCLRLIDSPYYGRIVSDKHFDRLCKIRNAYLGVKASEEQRRKVLFGRDENEWLGDPSSDDRYMPPMIIRCDEDRYRKDMVMKDEVFGPFLTLIPMKHGSKVWKKNAVNLVRDTDWKPLTAYVFSPDDEFVKYISDHVSAGSFAVNSVMSHAFLPNVPTGGTGLSGFGRYGGVSTFKTFSHLKPISYRSPDMEWVEETFYPSHAESAESNLRTLIPFRKDSREAKAVQVAAVVGAVAAVGLIVYKLRDNAYVKPVLTKAIDIKSDSFRILYSYFAYD